MDVWVKMNATLVYWCCLAHPVLSLQFSENPRNLKQNPQAIFKTLLKNRGFRKTPRGFHKTLFFLWLNPRTSIENPRKRRFCSCSKTVQNPRAVWKTLGIWNKTLGQFLKPSWKIEGFAKPPGGFAKPSETKTLGVDSTVKVHWSTGWAC